MRRHRNPALLMDKPNRVLSADKIRYLLVKSESYDMTFFCPDFLTHDNNLIREHFPEPDGVRNVEEIRYCDAVYAVSIQRLPQIIMIYQHLSMRQGVDVQV